MNGYWIYDIPNWLLGVLIVTLFCAVSVLGLITTRGLVRRFFGLPPGQNDVVSYYLGAFGVFYGLTVGLIAVATWQRFADLERLVAQEAAAVRVLDMDVMWYPSPVREELHRGLLAYVDYVLAEEWPAQQQGRIPDRGQALLLRFGQPLMAFQPETLGQEVLHEETVGAYSRYIDLRRQRVFNAFVGLPATVWWVLILGAALSIALTLLFSLPDLRAHLLLTVVLAGFVGLLIFLIAAMDHPFRGEFSVGAEPFKQVREQMVTQERLTDRPR